MRRDKKAAKASNAEGGTQGSTGWHRLCKQGILVNSLVKLLRRVHYHWRDVECGAYIHRRTFLAEAHVGEPNIY